MLILPYFPRSTHPALEIPSRTRRCGSHASRRRRLEHVPRSCAQRDARSPHECKSTCNVSALEAYGTFSRACLCPPCLPDAHGAFPVHADTTFSSSRCSRQDGTRKAPGSISVLPSWPEPSRRRFARLPSECLQKYSGADVPATGVI